MGISYWPVNVVRLFCAVILLVPSTLCGQSADWARLTAAAPGPSLAGRIRVAPTVGVADGRQRPEPHQWLPELRAVVMAPDPSAAAEPSAAGPDRVVLDWVAEPVADAEPTRYTPLEYRNDTWYGSTYWTGPDWTRVGKDWHHPGTHTASIRRFTAPRGGRVTVSGRVFKADTNGGDGVRLEVRHAGRTVWRAEIDGDDAQGVELDLQLDVQPSDAIRFVVHRRGTIGFDTTRWDPVVRYDDGQTFQASQAFVPGQADAGGWSFEMETDADGVAAPQNPVVRALDDQLRTVSRAVGPGQVQVLSGRDVLPAWVISDRGDGNGLILVWLSPDPSRLVCAQEPAGRLRIQLLAGGIGEPVIAAGAGQGSRSPHVLVAPYKGSWPAGLRALRRLLLAGRQVAGLEHVAAAVRDAARDLGLPAGMGPLPELEMCALIQEDWARQDALEDSVESYQRATQDQIDRTFGLLADLRGGLPAAQVEDTAGRLGQLALQARQRGLPLPAARRLYHRARWLKRSVVLANPQFAFGPLLFCKRVPTSYSHLVMQYYGWRARPGGGLFVLDKPGYSLACRDILDGQLAAGNVLEPRLDYDGQRIVFSYVACRPDGQSWDPAAVDNESDEGFYHLWSVHADGSGLRQLTHGPFDDLMPTWLPDGGIAFSSTRRRGYARCFGGQFSQRWHVYTIHRADGDGSNVRTLSMHDTNEWFPTVGDTGHVFYSRWDYIDRDAVTHQNLWAMRPDGTNPVAVWGNATSSPHCTFQAQAIPGTGKFVFTASAHHSITAGSIAILDPAVGVDGLEAITRLTPEIPFPEAEGREINEYYAAPWPLSETWFLVAYSPTPLVWEPGANARNALGIYLLDVRGNRELVYRDPDIGSTNPCPLVPRPCPPVLASHLPAEGSATGEVTLLDVYEGLGDVPRGAITQLRVIQIFPKTTNVADQPRIGMAREENARAILGTVPVEPDGSARFELPALKPVLFQALDRDGMAYQTMRTVTYVQPGEKVSCHGCHESRRTTPPNLHATALDRPPSVLEPGPLGGRPFSYVEVVQPILDAHCVRCHSTADPQGGFDLSGAAHQGFNRSYWALCGDRDFWGAGTNTENAAAALVPRFGGRNQVQVTPPGGQYGARGSRLLKILRAGHYEVRLGDEEFRRLAAWIDCNATFYGAYEPERQARQRRGERLPMPDVQ